MRCSEQLAQALRDAVGTYIQKEMEFPNEVLVTVTRAVISRNRHTATVFLSVFPEDHGEEILQRLQRARYTLQGVVYRAIDRHRAPRITFALDPGPAGLDRLECLSRSISLKRS